MGIIVERLLRLPQLGADPVARELAVVMTCPTGLSSAGFPYLQPAAWRRLRDWVPVLFHHGLRALSAADAVRDYARDLGDDDVLANVDRAHAVIAQVVRSAAICAPSDLWVLRAVLSHMSASGLLARLQDGGVVRDSDAHGLRPDEIAVDLRFLLGRGVLVRSEGGGHRLAPHAHARALAALPALTRTTSASSAWAALASGGADAGDTDVVRALATDVPAANDDDDVREQGVWSPTARECVVGSLVVPLVVGLAAAGRSTPLSRHHGRVLGTDLMPAADDAGDVALRILRAAAVLDDDDVITVLGKRVLERGPGPLGIIETYRTYTDVLQTVWREGRRSVHVERGHNVAASQAANAKSFGEANDALDAFCAETGFSYSVFVEHALGRGEATRQRFAKAGTSLHYVGADLEDAAIDAAKEEQRQGRLPAGMVFVGDADIQIAEKVTDAIEKNGWSADGAVMIVGNGFHEVRDQTDERITAVFQRYADKGVVVIFTEESALSVDDLLETAYNTYHAGFRYVHERSGQHLRPAEERPAGALEDSLSRSWAECATRAGYVRVERFCRRGRTIYPSPSPSGHNPAVSVTHFLVPKALAARLGL